MERIITATKARIHFGELIRQEVERNQAVIVESDGVPQVVVLSLAEYERLRAARPAGRRDALERIGLLGDRVLARRRGRPLLSVEDVLADMHEDRGADYDRWR